MLEQIKPEGALQSMLAAQMIGVHNTAIKFLMRATDENQTFEGADANVLPATLSCGYLTNSCRPSSV